MILQFRRPSCADCNDALGSRILNVSRLQGYLASTWLTSPILLENVSDEHHVVVHAQIVGVVAVAGSCFTNSHTICGTPLVQAETRRHCPYCLQTMGTEHVALVHNVHLMIQHEYTTMTVAVDHEAARGLFQVRINPFDPMAASIQSRIL